MLLPRGWTDISEWSKTIPKEKFKAVEVWYKREKHVYYCYAKVSYDNPELEGDPVFLCTNRLDWEVFRILRTYVKRWRIDTFYRDAKQSLGLEDYEIRKIKGFFKKLDSLLSFPLPDFVEEILILIYLGFVYSYKVVKES